VNTLLTIAACLMVVACRAAGDEESGDPFATARATMVRDHLAKRDISDARVLAAMGRVPRHRLIPPQLQSEAYADRPLSIGHNQTISQPYIVAFMSQASELQPTDKVLEIGTGSGYQAAILAELVANVYSIEIVAPLAEQAAVDLAELGYKNIHLRTGDGYAGWPEEAPFDAIILTAAPPHQVPQPLLDQLAEGGRLVAPVGTGIQELVRYRKVDGELQMDKLLAVRFVPMTGEAQGE
jgi:protein-L-isoaspartate(D-aspartate) O-methyltransferase